MTAPGSGRSGSRLIDEQFKLAKAEGREEPLEAYAFDALIELADACRPTPTDPRPTEPAEKPKRRRSGHRRSTSR